MQLTGYGLKVEVYKPKNEAVIEFVSKNGEKAMYQSIELRKSCCGMRPSKLQWTSTRRR